MTAAADPTGDRKPRTDPEPVDHLGSDPLELVLAERFRHLAVGDLSTTLASITALAVETTVSDHASITLIDRPGSLSSAAVTDDAAAAADRLQYELGEGPCLTAAADGGYYAIADTATDPRWPRWGPAVRQSGIRSVLSIHLFTANRMLGALNLYDEQSRGYTDEEIIACRVVAAHASVALARSRTEQDLWRAVDARHLIGQAQGILMERYSINAEQAFSVLRRYSQNSNRKLSAVAGHLVSTSKLPDSN
ncbi:GAF and ANTAR domain-containing protein [Nakamurella lactea]|uniref:GAF and ANTAR domain-containing protein n=1 Tax=Nakamurella lactea TaxID=459515 RepID=UPI00040087D0|nr:GAF and ANTAR domain-containing protein [Nakamurella lactea]